MTNQHRDQSQRGLPAFGESAHSDMTQDLVRLGQPKICFSGKQIMFPMHVLNALRRIMQQQCNFMFVFHHDVPAPRSAPIKTASPPEREAIPVLIAPWNRYSWSAVD